jgi:hypothetical protein
MTTVNQFISHAEQKGYRFSQKEWPIDGSQTWLLTAPDGRTFGRWVPAVGEDERTKQIVDGGLETIRCIEENVFPCGKL